mmetsp:Transcript_54743/g.150905  ORF Transcript_54743/g.150905 Transcript_54743/m.150905 type:complete len:202 (+) Transcript_54743:64-669(+)|eukprot:CAMPEP_0119507644 /NCGR_PEP_ID=MMETSP1344-20130328/27478_1 /TAXON_ID=236787 /ORGANISM="Florenciella parvula, Strain CCMP2471" /LENGTH=201 /DNA_ID=CAMNT_0007544293 /DNA_START=44 /DNA_END=649 /DNA_ORIENTATION=-
MVRFNLLLVRALALALTTSTALSEKSLGGTPVALGDSNVTSATVCGNAVWDHCEGGSIDDASRCCPTGTFCKYQNEYYSQCTPAADSLAAGDYLFYSNSITSANGKYWVVQQSDGNLVLYTAGKALWASHTNTVANAETELQQDGNLVVYPNGDHASQGALWAAGTAGYHNATAKIQDDGNFVIRDADGVAIWASHTNQAN